MMDIDFNRPPSVPTATTSTVINVSQWDIDGDQIHGTSSLASVEDPIAESTPLATDTTTQATFDYLEANSTFHEVDSTFHEDDSTFHEVDEDINQEHDPSAKRSFIGVSHLCLTTITAVLNHVLFFFKDNPMLAWLKYTKDFLFELLRLDGRGKYGDQPKCSRCLKGEPQYRCRDCLGGSLFCADCIADNHRSNMFHYIEVSDPLFSYS